VHTGRSPPEEEQSFHSVRVHAACGGANQPDDEEEAVFISVVNTNEDPPNAHQRQLSLLVMEEAIVFKPGGDPLNTQHVTRSKRLISVGRIN